jgi:hypothetical protein
MLHHSAHLTPWLPMSWGVLAPSKETAGRVQPASPRRIRKLTTKGPRRQRSGDGTGAEDDVGERGERTKAIPAPMTARDATQQDLTTRRGVRRFPMPSGEGNSRP